MSLCFIIISPCVCGKTSLTYCGVVRLLIIISNQIKCPHHNNSKNNGWYNYCYGENNRNHIQPYWNVFLLLRIRLRDSYMHRSSLKRFGWFLSSNGINFCHFLLMMPYRFLNKMTKHRWYVCNVVSVVYVKTDDV